MYRGSVVEELDSSLLTTAAGHRYTQGLVRCVPTLEDADRESLETIGEWLDLGGQDGTDDVTERPLATADARAGSSVPDPGGYVQLVATDVTKVFGRRRSQRHTAVDGVSLTVESGQAVGIVGESGSGKSTFARILAGIELPTAGTVYFNDVPIASQLSGRDERLNLRRHVQMVAQDTSSSFDPLKTLRASVRTPVMRLLGFSRAQADAKTDRVMADLELAPPLADRYPQHVSGGQRQRFALARALIVRPGLLICDEVVSALDVSVQGSVLNMLRRYCAESGAGLVFVSQGRRHRLHLRPHRGHAARPDRRERPDRRGARPASPRIHPSAARRVPRPPGRPAPPVRRRRRPRAA